MKKLKPSKCSWNIFIDLCAFKFWGRAEIDSDHLVIEEFKMKVAEKRIFGGSCQKCFNVVRIKEIRVRKEAEITKKHKKTSLQLFQR